MENFKEAFADGKTMSDLMYLFEIKTIDVAVEYAMTPEQSAAKKLKEKEAAENKQKLQAEYRAEFEALQKERLGTLHQQKKQRLNEKAAEAQDAEDDKAAEAQDAEDDKAAEAEEAQDAKRLKNVQDVLARRDSLGSLDGKMVEMSVSDLVICSAYDAKVKMNDSKKLEMMRTEIRFYRHALKSKAIIHGFDYDEALAEAKSMPEVAQPTGQTQDPWAPSDEEEEQTPGTSI
jgi:hypothetical protein